MEFLWKKRLLTVLYIGLFIIFVPVFMNHNTGRVEGHPHEVWTLSEEFPTLEKAVEFLNDYHIESFQIVRDDDGRIKVVYERFHLR